MELRAARLMWGMLYIFKNGTIKYCSYFHPANRGLPIPHSPLSALF